MNMFSMNILGMLPHHLIQHLDQLDDQGFDLLDQGEFAEAVDCFQQSLSLIREAKKEFGRFKQYKDILVGFRKREAACLGNMSIAYSMQGKLNKSLSCEKRALKIDIHVESDPYLVAIGVNNIGNIYRLKGDLTTALEHCQKALEISRLVTRHSPESQIHTNLGLIYKSQGDATKALEHFQAALTAVKKSNPQSGETATCFNNLGLVYVMQGDLVKGLYCFKRALKIRNKYTPHDNATASIIHNMGGVYHLQYDLIRSQDDLKRAIRCYDRALKVSNDVLMQAQCLNSIGSVYSGQGKYDESLAAFQQSLKLNLLISPNSQETATNLSNIGGVYYMQGNLQSALKNFKHALKIDQKSTPQSENVANRLNNIGNVYQAQMKFELALRYYKESASVVEKIRSRMAVSGRQIYFSKSQNAYYNYIITALIRGTTDDVAAAFQMAERTRARTIVDLIQRSSIQTEASQNRNLLDEERKVLSQIVTQEANPALRTKNARHLRELHEELVALDRRIQEAFPGLKTLQGVEPLTLEAVRKRLLSSSTLLLSFCATEDAYVGWAARDTSMPDGVQVLRIGIKDDVDMATRAAVGEFLWKPLLLQYEKMTQTEAVQEKCAKLRADLEWTRENKEAAWAGLSAAIWGQIRSELTEGVTRILVLPDGELNALPFDLLPVPDTNATSAGEMLGGRYEITYAPSATALDQLQKMRDARPAAPNGEPPPFFLGFGDPDFNAAPPASDAPDSGDSSDTPRAVARRKKGQPPPQPPQNPGNHIAPLPGTRWEVEEIASGFGPDRRKTFFGADVTKESIYEHLYRATVLHGATHGVFNNEAPLCSGLMLAGGIVWEAREILGLRERLYLDLVVGSACDTARGAAQPGDGFVGLRAALAAIGVRCALLSLWPVSDTATQEFMAAFYAHWRGGARPIHEALRAARATVKALPGFDDPYYWAGFIPIGFA